MAINKIHRKKVWQEVAEELQRLIVDGHWEKGRNCQGGGPSQGVRCEPVHFEGSSAGPEFQGLVQIRHGKAISSGIRGRRLPQPSDAETARGQEDVFAIMEARSMVEVKTAALAAERATAETIAELRSLLENMERSRKTASSSPTTITASTNRLPWPLRTT